MLLEVLRPTRYPMGSPIGRGGKHNESTCADAAMHEIGNVGPAQYQHHVEAAHVRLRRAREIADVELDIGIARVEPG